MHTHAKLRTEASAKETPVGVYSFSSHLLGYVSLLDTGLWGTQ